MKDTEILIPKPIVKKDKKSKLKIAYEVHEESQVIVHCRMNSDSDSIRIWKSTFLFSHECEHRSKLVHAVNISMFPKWTNIISPNYTFTLIFSGLPKSCKTFDLLEQIPESGGFNIKNIKRNKSDVYNLEIG
jgi:hypothetical protein